ncbi:MAG: exodeoxyribonuclease III [Magnetospirillum sp. WYHS-4]
MALRIATWNVNSLRRRLDGLQRLSAWLAPDVVCLQETKVTDELFPADDLAALGYPHQVFKGMKSYNGVAVISRLPLTDAGSRDWCGRADCRHVWATVHEPETGRSCEVHSLYLPAGGDVPDADDNPKFAHKLRFLEDLIAWSGERRGAGRPTVLAGDLNVAPLPTDVWSHEKLRNVVTHTEGEVRLLTEALAAGGWIDSVRHRLPAAERVYTWWSYRAKDWEGPNRGRRLDHIWLSPDLEPALADVHVLREARGWSDPSDHVPVAVALEW